MKTNEIRKAYLDYFITSPRSHREISASPLVLEGDPTTLFTSAGMQQLVACLKGKRHPKGKRLVNSQPSLRTGDIDEVGDFSHLTFFEMLGNWSLGDYFKVEQLSWIWDFYTESLSLAKDRLWVSVFEGEGNVPKDEESLAIWKKLGVPEKRIYFYGTDKNWWSRSGAPDQMPIGEIGGPDSEVFYDFGEVKKLHENSPFSDQECHPNCQCGRFVEIGNSVFIEYEQGKDEKLTELSQKNVDFGGGLERIAMAVNDLPDMFEIDIFKPIVKALEKETGIKYKSSEKNDRSMRIIADHVRACAMLAAEGVVPSNKLQGYVLRRLIRRSIFHLHLLGAGVSGSTLVHISESLKGQYPIVERNWKGVSDEITAEGAKFVDALQRGTKKLTKMVNEKGRIDGKDVFNLYQSEGFPLELTLEILKQNGIMFGEKEKKLFEEELERHQSMSRSATTGMFKGGLADKSETVTKLHTVTHLLHESLRRVLGEYVSQKGSNITSERLRFDFTHPRKLSGGEIKEVEDLINRQVKSCLPVSFQEMSFDEAKKEGALAFFGERYGDKVKVYTVGPVSSWFSKEVCGGPHVASTKEIGRVKIIKQEKIGSQTMRLYAVVKE